MRYAETDVDDVGVKLRFIVPSREKREWQKIPPLRDLNFSKVVKTEGITEADVGLELLLWSFRCMSSGTSWRSVLADI